MPIINSAGLAIIESSEGLRLQAYRDAVGVITIGYGHTGPDVYIGITITPARAVELLEADCRAAEAEVQRLVEVALTPNQFSACVSLVFNIGASNFKGSSTLREINASDWTAAAKAFLLWDEAGGRVLPGLAVRRQRESALFLTA